MTEVLIDTGHLTTTLGKGSPDGRLREVEWAAEVGAMTARLLRCDRIPVWTVPHHEGMTDAADLRARVRAANAHNPGTDRALVSVHCNAAGNDGRWRTARGWSVFVAPNASEDSKALAESLCMEARIAGFKVRTQYVNVGYWVQSLAICRDTVMPAVLVENFFMDNQEDCAFLLSDEGKTMCASVMARGVQRWMRGRG